MSTQVTLKATRRDESGKGVARKLRAAGKLPAVVYGGPDETVPVVLDAHDTTNLFHSISVENTIVNLEVDGEKAPVPSLVREIQTHPYRSEILHVDFFRIQEGVEVELEVPIHLEGTPTGVKDDGGVLEQTIYMLPLRCLPTAIPEEILVDVTALEIHDSLHVADLDLPEGVTVLLDLQRTVCSVQAPSMAEVEVEEGEEEPELIGAEEGEEEAEAPAAEAEDEGEEPES
jgi:large subunit ribosomal protein L25